MSTPTDDVRFAAARRIDEDDSRARREALLWSIPALYLDFFLIVSFFDGLGAFGVQLNRLADLAATFAILAWFVTAPMVLVVTFRNSAKVSEGTFVQLFLLCIAAAAPLIVPIMILSIRF